MEDEELGHHGGHSTGAPCGVGGRGKAELITPQAPQGTWGATAPSSNKDLRASFVVSLNSVLEQGINPSKGSIAHNVVSCRVRSAVSAWVYPLLEHPSSDHPHPS